MRIHRVLPPRMTRHNRRGVSRASCGKVSRDQWRGSECGTRAAGGKEERVEAFEGAVAFGPDHETGLAFRLVGAGRRGAGTEGLLREQGEAVVERLSFGHELVVRERRKARHQARRLTARSGRLLDLARPPDSENLWPLRCHRRFQYGQHACMGWGERFTTLSALAHLSGDIGRRHTRILYSVRNASPRG